MGQPLLGRIWRGIFGADFIGFDSVEFLLENQSLVARRQKRGQSLVCRFDFGPIPRSSGHSLPLRFRQKIGVRGLPPHQLKFYVYVLKSKKDGEFYIGSTNDLRRRFKEHNDGKVFSTKSHIPFEIIYYEAYKKEEDARRRESNLKLRSRAFAQLKKRIGASSKT